MTKAFQSDSYQFHQPLCCSTADFLNCTCHRAWTRSVSNNTSLTAAMHHTDHAHKQSQSMQTMRTKNWRRSASGRWRSACWRRWRRASSAMTLGWCQATEAAVTQCNKFAYYLWIVFYYRTAVQKGLLTFSVTSFPVYIVLYFKLCLILLYVAYFWGRFSFMSFSVCCGMTLGAAVCHASY